jgi:hypothetical protein
MKTPSLFILLQFAGLMHLGLIAAGALMPRAVNLRHHAASLPPFLGRLFWVYYAFIGLSLVAFGALSYFLAAELACSFLSLFWMLRLFAACFLFDVRPYLTNRYWRAGYHATNVVFALLPVIYLWAALKGGAS